MALHITGKMLDRVSFERDQKNWESFKVEERRRGERSWWDGLMVSVAITAAVAPLAYYIGLLLRNR